MIDAEEEAEADVDADVDADAVVPTVASGIPLVVLWKYRRLPLLFMVCQLAIDALSLVLVDCLVLQEATDSQDSVPVLLAEPDADKA